MHNLNRIIRSVLLEQFDNDELNKLNDSLDKYSEKMGRIVDDILGIDGYVRSKFIPDLMSDIKKGEYGYTVDDVKSNLGFLNKIPFAFNTVNSQNIPNKIKNSLYKSILSNEFCPSCKSNDDVRNAVTDYVNQKTPKSRPKPQVKSKEYTPSKSDMVRLEKLAKSGSKAKDIWRKYGIGSKTLKMGDHTVTIQLNKDITVGNQDLKTKKNYETTFDKDSESLIYRVKNIDVYFKIERTPKKGEKYDVVDINIIDRQGKNLKTPIPKPSSLTIGVIDVSKN